MTLLQVSNNVWVRVVGFTKSAGMEDKLRQLGLVPGDRARVLRQAPFGGPLLVEAGGRAIALGRNVAGKVEVVEILEDEKCDLHW